MPKVARVHYEIDDDLHRKAKAAASLEGQTLRVFLVRALQAAVERVERERGVDLGKTEESGPTR
jgi:hypothetical protein